MKRPYLCVILITFLVPEFVQGQLTVNTAPTPTQLVEDVLVGSGVQVTNVTYTGASAQIGSFDATNANLMSIDSGVVMASGEASYAIGPNTSYNGSTGSPPGAVNGDNHLLQANNGTSVNDVSILEFDFVPQGDTIEFNYIFGSEEYMTYATGINDVFGFFIRGPGINGTYSNNAENIATIPGTGQAVNLSNVNANTNAAYYVDNGDDPSGLGTPPAPHSTDPAYIQYDGHTVVMTAKTAVLCDSTYHMKLAIADGSDNIIDSGVFLEANSFMSNAFTIETDMNVGLDDSTIWEGCGGIDFDIVRQKQDSNLTDTVYVEKSGTATEGVDYTALSDTLFFPPNQDSSNISLSAFDDSIIEGTENAIIDFIYQDQSACGNWDTATVEFYIDDPDTVQINTMNDTVMGACTDSVELWASATGGTGDYEWTWDKGVPNGDSSGYVSPNDTTTYTVSTSDTCAIGMPEDSMTVFVPTYDPLEVYASNDTTFVCPSQSVPVGIDSITGGSGNSTFWWDSLGGDSSYAVSPSNTSIYILNAVDTCLRDTAVDGVQVTQGFDPLQVKAAPDTNVCTGDPANLRTEWTTGGIGDHSYVWEPDSLRGTPLWVQSDTAISSSTYTVTAIDSCGVTAKDSMVVSTQTPRADFDHEAQAYETEERISFNNRSWNASSFFWDFGYADHTSTKEDTSITYPEEGSYEVSLLASDRLGCQDSISKEIDINKPFNFYVPNAFTPNNDGQNDVFHGMGEGFEFESYNMKVFDRWGELVFESENPERGWDGTYRGEPLPEGVYIYKISVEGENGQRFEKEGHVNLIR